MRSGADGPDSGSFIFSRIEMSCWVKVDEGILMKVAQIDIEDEMRSKT